MGKVSQQYITIPNTPYFEQVKAMLGQDKLVKIPVAGTSMLPFLRPGDVVELSSPGNGLISSGMIALATYQKGYVLHRVIHVSAKSVFLSGSNNLAQVERVDKEDVIALVYEAYRNGRRLDVNTNKQVFKTWLWHQIRPLRYLYRKILMTIK